MNTTWHADPSRRSRCMRPRISTTSGRRRWRPISSSASTAGARSRPWCRPPSSMPCGARSRPPWPRRDPASSSSVLLRLGVHEHVARLLAATPSLRLSWFFAEAFALGSAAFAAQNTAGTRAGGPALFLFLVLAALAPVAGVAAAFGPGIDPSYEIGVASPMRTDRLLFIRATAVLVASVLIGSIAAIALPGMDRTVTLWLLPGPGPDVGHAGGCHLAASHRRGLRRGAGVDRVRGRGVGGQRRSPRTVPPHRSARVRRCRSSRACSCLPNATQPTKERSPHERAHRGDHRCPQTLRPHHRPRRTQLRRTGRHHRPPRSQRRRQDHLASDGGHRAGTRYRPDPALGLGPIRLRRATRDPPASGVHAPGARVPSHVSRRSSSWTTSRS